MKEIDMLIIKNDKGGEGRITNQVAASSYGLPVFSSTMEEFEGDFGPADIINWEGHYFPVANLIITLARHSPMSDSELEAVDLFLSQWPEGPQLPKDPTRRC